jgi:hypothetical protein
MTDMPMTTTSAEAMPVELGTKYIRWGLGLFVFGLVIGYGPWLHYMHGALEDVHEAFLKNVTLWFGCPWTLATYVAQLGGLSMVVIGLCYLVFAREGVMASVAGGERIAPVLCVVGVIAEFVVGFPGYFAVGAIWPDFYFTPIQAGKWTWLGIQGVCIAIYVVGVMYAYGGIKRASHLSASRSTRGTVRA